MVIKTEAFQKNQKLISHLWNKNEGVYGGIYFDFVNKVAYLNMGTNKMDIKGKAKFPFEFSGNAPENFFVESSKFLSLVSLYDELEYDIEKESFFNGKDKFKIESITPIDEVDTSMFDNTTEAKLSFTEDQVSLLKKAKQFTTNVPEANPVFKTIFSTGNDIFSMFDNQLFQANTNIPEMKMNNEAFDIIMILGTDSKFGFYDNFIIIENEGVTSVVPNNQAIEAPPINTPQFVESYSHNTYFSLGKDEIQNIIKFLEMYYKENDSKNNTLHFLKEKDEDELKIESITTKDSILRTINFIDTNISEMDFYVDALKLKLAVSTIEAPVIKFKWCADKYAIETIGIVGNEETNYHIIFSYMR